MNFITSDTDLRKYIPNMEITLDDDTSFFERIHTQLIAAEAFVQAILVPSDLLVGDDLRELVSKAVACHAFALAVPQLDLYLTSNGFGIISNNNTAPASRERVSALIESLYRTRDEALQAAILILSDVPAIRSKYYDTLFVGFEAQERLASTHRYEDWLHQHIEVIDIESRIGYQYISTTLMARLRATTGLTTEEQQLKDRLKAIILDALKLSGNLPVDRLTACVTTIRQTPTLLAQWENTLTANIYKDYTFKNDKLKGGFWL